MNFDLHMHSSYSKDGEKSPQELIQIAKEKGLDVVALCDHDSIQGVHEMKREGEKESIQVIHGIECSTLFEGHECHLLGYGIDLQDPYFLSLTNHVLKLCDDAFHERIVKLEAKYPIHIDEAQVLKDAGDENPWFLLCERIFNDPQYQTIEDFKDYIPGGKRSDPAPVNFFWDKCQKGSDLYVYVNFPDFKVSVQKIHESGGLAILAHPFNTFYQNEDLLMKAIEAGIDGIEVFSNYHEPYHNAYYEKFAKEHHLLMTCGSDYHGKHKPSIQMGEYGEVTDKDQILQNFLNQLKNSSNHS